MSLSERQAALRRVGSLSNLTDREIYQLAANCSVKTFMAGEEIESINDEYRYFFVVLQGKISLSRVSWAVGKRGFERVLPRLEKRETRGVGAGDCWGEERLNEEMRNRSGSFSSVNSKFVSEVSVAQDKTEVLMLDVRVR